VANPDRSEFPADMLAPAFLRRAPCRDRLLLERREAWSATIVLVVVGALPWSFADPMFSVISFRSVSTRWLALSM
jgi:hypothetical protein